MPPTHWTLDHLVVATDTLENGRRWLEQQLGVSLQPGGQHAEFGTHNLLLSLGGSYLELIAIDPSAPQPADPRWFELDRPEMQQRLAERPHLIHWVVAVPELTGHPQARRLSRGGARWQLTVAPDGSLPGGGAAPSLIAWDTPPPAQSLPDQGVQLEQLELSSPHPERLAHWTGSYNGTEIVAQSAPTVSLRATLVTPKGHVRLD